MEKTKHKKSEQEQGRLSESTEHKSKTMSKVVFFFEDHWKHMQWYLRDIWRDWRSESHRFRQIDDAKHYVVDLSFFFQVTELLRVDILQYDSARRYSVNVMCPPRWFHHWKTSTASRIVQSGTWSFTVIDMKDYVIKHIGRRRLRIIDDEDLLQYDLIKEKTLFLPKAILSWRVGKVSLFKKRQNVVLVFFFFFSSLFRVLLLCRSLSPFGRWDLQLLFRSDIIKYCYLSIHYKSFYNLQFQLEK